MLGDEITADDIVDDGNVAGGGEFFGDFLDIHCSIVSKWIFSWIYESRNSGCSVRYALTEYAVNDSVFAVKREREKQ